LDSTSINYFNYDNGDEDITTPGFIITERRKKTHQCVTALETNPETEKQL
jgi:hypothetical protein